MKTRNSYLTFFTLVFFAFTACTNSTDKAEGSERATRASQVEQDKTIGDVTIGKPEVAHISDNYDMLTTFANLCQRGNIDSLLEEGEKYTIFAPSDEAFRNFRNQAGNADSTYYQNLAQFIVKDTYTATDLLNKKSLETLDGNTIQISNANGEIRVGDAKIIYTDLEASNAIIQVVDEVIVTSAN